ncbi:MAG: phenylalanine--tRNA ligase subunit beta [Deltaproteobacteria bacterium]|nr:phenylalanine--tRNA ligase subunit beta [Deltaproteobacteria bacterium]
MKISYAWIVELLQTDPGLDRVVRALTDGGLEVEHVAQVGTHLQSVCVAVVQSVRAHPTSKNPLSLVTVDLGQGASLEVVCGASNVPAPGGCVLFAPAGAHVFDKKGSLFELVEKPVAGIVSKGMLCSEIELGLGGDDNGIIVLDAPVAAGTPLLTWFSAARDTVLELNVTPNRPDALGHLGVARDIAALLDLPFAEPSNEPHPTREATASEQFSVQIESDRCPRFSAAVMTVAGTTRSPLWLRTRLWRLGVRAIDSVVDCTNLVMFELGQPTHVYDLDAIEGHALTVRAARSDETLQTLDGKTRALLQGDVVIADAGKCVGLAGVMGGEGSGVSSGTTRLLLEAAHFDASAVRRMAKRHDMHTDASHRFERGVDPQCPPKALARLQHWLATVAGAVQAGKSLDIQRTDSVALQPREPLVVRTSRVARVLGVQITPSEIATYLSRLGFKMLSHEGDAQSVRAPTHRPDVLQEIDVIEEIGRVHGYDKIHNAVLPASGASAGARGDYALRRATRNALAASGLDEAVTYSFVSDRVLADFAMESSVRIANPLSQDRAALRPSLLPGLLQSAAVAVRYGERRGRLFEVGTVFGALQEVSRAQELTETRANRGPVQEHTCVGLVMMGEADQWLSLARPLDLFDLKGVVESLVERLGRGTVVADRVGEPPAWAHPAAFARLTLDGEVLGTIAVLHPDVRERFEASQSVTLPAVTLVGELRLSVLAGLSEVTLKAKAPPKTPAMVRDVALLVARSHPAASVVGALREGAGSRCVRAEIFDRYVGDELPEGTHSLAISLVFRGANEETLTDVQVDQWMQAALARATETLGATQR